MKTYRKLKSKKSVHWKAAAALAAAFCTLGLSGTMAAEVSNGGDTSFLLRPREVRQHKIKITIMTGRSEPVR